MRNLYVISAMIILLSSAVPMSWMDDEGVVSALVSHSPIYIDGNSQLDSTASAEGWTGNGMESNPYMIQNYDIPASTWAIRVYNTDRHLVIYDCHGRDGSRSGILLNNVRNASVLDSRWTENDEYGIHLIDCEKVVVDGNRFDATMVMVNNYNHIVLERSTYCRISNNTVVFSQNDGIQLMDHSEYNVVENNFCKNMYKAIYVNSENNMIRYNSGYENSFGVYLEKANNTVMNNSMFYNAYGLYSYFAGYNLLYNNTCQRNYIGIFLNFAHDHVVRDNLLLKNCNYGIYIYADLDANNRIFWNDLFYNNNSGASFDPARVQCKDRFGGNQWNDTEGRGNFWWDWRGPDSDEDGIVDDPYPIAGAAVYDNHPLTTSEIPDTSQPPQDLTALGGPDFINISWSPPPYSSTVSINQYRVYRGLRAGGESEYINLDGNDTFFMDHDVTEGDRYYYYMTAITDIGESNRSVRRSAVPDSISPTVVIKTDDDLYTNNEWFRVSWTGNDNVGVITYEISLDGKEPLDIGKVSEYTFGGLDEGDHHVVVTVYDEGLNSGQDSITFHVDLTDPWINITGPSIEPGAVVNITSFDLSWIGGDFHSGISFYEVKVFGGDWISLGTELGYHVECVNDEWHIPTVRAVDLAGNTAEDSLAFYIDLRLPEIEFIELDGYYFDETELYLNWTYGDAHAGLDTLEIRVDDGDWEDIGLTDNRTLTDLSEGNHTVYIRAWDLAGNSRSDRTSFVIDISSPDLEITTPVEYLLNNSMVEVEWQGMDAFSPMQRYGIRVDEEPWQWIGLNTSWIYTELDDGLHLIEVRGVDVAGNGITANTTVRIDTGIPRVLGHEPEGNSVEANTTISIAFSEEMDPYTVDVRIRGISVDLTWSGNTVSYTPQNPLTKGSTYDVLVVGFDFAGNEMTPFSWTFRVEEEDFTEVSFFLGMVVDEKGRPIEDAGISVNITTYTRTDENGYFRLEVTPGLHTLTIARDGFVMISMNGYVEAGETKNLGEIEMESLYPEEEERESRLGLMIAAGLVVLFLIALIAILTTVIRQRMREYPIFLEDEGWMRMYPHRK